MSPCAKRQGWTCSPGFARRAPHHFRFGPARQHCPRNSVRPIRRCLLVFGANPDEMLIQNARAAPAFRPPTPAGATAAFGLAQAASAFTGKTEPAFARHLLRAYDTLAASRPTAVDLVNAMNEVRAAMTGDHTIAQQQRLALQAARL